jgi:hypothetical protein
LAHAVNMHKRVYERALWGWVGGLEEGTQEQRSPLTSWLLSPWRLPLPPFPRWLHPGAVLPPLLLGLAPATRATLWKRES